MGQVGGKVGHVRGSGRLSARQRGYFDAVGVLICEVVLLAVLVNAGSVLGTVDLTHFARWLQATSPQRVVTAWLRVFGTAVSGWLLLTTVVYGLAALSGKRGLLAQVHPVTLPILRRALDAMAAASVAASSIGSTAALAGASVPAHPPITAVQPLKTPRPAALAVARVPRHLVAPQSVASSAIGRHFPHPGLLDHELPATSAFAGKPEEVPSQANGFAGLRRGTKVIVVERGDCLSVLAARHLGDWRLDSEIEALNFGRVQPDGRALVNDHWIYPGWVLVMPADAVGAQVVGGGNVLKANAGHRPTGHEGEPLAAPLSSAAPPLSHHAALAQHPAPAEHAAPAVHVGAVPAAPRCCQARSGTRAAKRRCSRGQAHGSYGARRDRHGQQPLRAGRSCRRGGDRGRGDHLAAGLVAA